MKDNLNFIGSGLTLKNWIDNPKSNFDFGLPITTQSTKLDCNPDWAIQQYPGCIIQSAKKKSRCPISVSCFSIHGYLIKAVTAQSIFWYDFAEIMFSSTKKIFILYIL